MDQTNAVSHPSSNNPHCLAAFDFAFNGTLDPAQVQELVSAAFVGRGENLLIIGGCGTGKTVIVMEVRQHATALGMTSEYLSSPSPNFAEDALISPSYGFAGATGDKQGLRQELLDCDVLLVDEVEKWLEAVPVAFLILLGRRIELGKANVLTAMSGRWNRLCGSAGESRHSMSVFGDAAFNHPAFLLGTKPEQRSEWGMMMVHDRFMPVPYLLKALGLEYTVPGMEGDLPAHSSAARAALRADVRPDPSLFARMPVWHKLYTGEKSYREILRRRA